MRQLRGGNELAFERLVASLHGSLLRTATAYVRDPSAAEDVVQETWAAFIESLDRFEGRCSVKSWLFRILFNKAQSRAGADRRLVPFATLARREAAALSPDDAIDACTSSWTTPDQAVRDREFLEHVRAALSELPPAQATVMWMRDVEGLESREVCASLGISPANQRVLLHRARTGVRRALTMRYEAEPCVA